MNLQPIRRRRYRGHMTEVAKRLGIGRATIYRKIRDFDIAVPDTSS